MAAKFKSLKQREDDVRRVLMLEPRGHLDITGALFTEAVSPGSHAGIVFMNHAGFSTVPGSAVMAAAAIGLSQGLVMPGGDGRNVTFDTPVGVVRAIVGDGDSAASVSVVGPPAFVLMPGLTVPLGNRSVKADVAFGSGFFALVDGEAAGVGSDQSHLPALRQAGVEIAAAVNDRYDIVHPADATLHGVDGTIFTAPPNDPESDLRAIVVSSTGTVDRSAGGCAIGALMAVLDAMSLLDDGRSFRIEGLVNTSMAARVAQRSTLADLPAVLVSVESSAWITGEHTFFFDAGDPLGPGIQLSATRVRRTAGIRE